jgi:hypothetical protein
MAASEMYLDITIAGDGRFRGEWKEYLCASSIGAYGYIAYSCKRDGGTGGVISGTLDRSGGVADLGRWGRQPLVVKTVDADEFIVELPQGWRGESFDGYRARLRREGAPEKPLRSEEPPPPKDTDESGQVLSANALFREFSADATTAGSRYGGQVMTLEGRVGDEVILSSDGVSAAVHIADGFLSRALILMFPDRRDVAGVTKGTRLRFRCSVNEFKYEILWLENCSTVR